MRTENPSVNVKARKSRSFGKGCENWVEKYGSSQGDEPVSSHTKIECIDRPRLARTAPHSQPPMRRSGTLKQNQHVSVSNGSSEYAWKLSSTSVKAGLLSVMVLRICWVYRSREGDATRRGSP